MRNFEMAMWFGWMVGEALVADIIAYWFCSWATAILMFLGSISELQNDRFLAV